MSGAGPWQSWQLRHFDLLAAPEAVASRLARARSPPLAPLERMVEREAHVPCLLKEAVQQLLSPKLRRPDGTYDGTYVDCTFGRGGHTREILSHLSPNGRLFAFDVDPEAVEVGWQLERADSRFRIIHRPFGDLAQEFPEPGQLNGVLVDLGVSSPQLDDYHRGFNIRNDYPPDMRMNQNQGIPAYEWLQRVTAEELAWVIHSYGEDDDALLSERIAEYILLKQKDEGGSIRSTKRLADIVCEAKNNFDDYMHPAKLTSQAIRVFLNQEMEQLDRLLNSALDTLAFGGRFCLIVFKRKEANAVRKFVREHEEPDPYLVRTLNTARLCELFPLLLTTKDFSVKQLCEAIKPSHDELENNRRARSAAVHVLGKMQRSAPVLQANVRGIQERFQRPTLQPDFVGSSSAQAQSSRHAPELHSAAAHDVDAQATQAEDEGHLVQFLARITRSYCVSQVGYLQLTEGEEVKVLYEGLSGEEAGWWFGIKDDAYNGWFPAECACRLTPALAG